MEERLWLRQARKGIGQSGWILLIYHAIMNAVVLFVCMLDMAVYMIVQSVQTGTLDMELLMTHVTEFVTTNGWGFILAIAIGGLIVLLWKKRSFWREEVFRTSKPMTVGTFMQLLCVVVSVQAVAQIVIPLLELFLNLLGFTALAALETATMTSTGISMFVYITLLGPLAEELLFRGLVLRQLQPYGKQFAIVASAILFGMFHGNIVQIPYTMLLGLVLGYVTVEHSIVWAIVFHIFNNLVLSDLLSRLSQCLPEYVGEGLLLLILAVALVATIVILIWRKEDVKAYLTENRLSGPAMKAMFTAPGILVFVILMLLSSLLTITPQ